MCAEVGVGGAVGDPFQVAVDEAGVGLGFGAGVDLLVGELDEVGAAFLGQVGGGREADVLRRQLVADVVAGEVVAPHQQPAGDGERRGGDDAEPDEHAVDGASLERDDRLGDGASSTVLDRLIGRAVRWLRCSWCFLRWSDLSPRRYETTSELVRGRRPLVDVTLCPAAARSHGPGLWARRSASRAA